MVRNVIAALAGCLLCGLARGETLEGFARNEEGNLHVIIHWDGSIPSAVDLDYSPARLFPNWPTWWARRRLTTECRGAPTGTF